MGNDRPPRSLIAEAPTAGAAIMVCPRCGAKAQHNWLLIQSNDPADWGSIGFFDEAVSDMPFELIDGQKVPAPSEWRAGYCIACEQKTLWRNDQLIYPQRPSVPPPHKMMDSAAKALYEEARLVLPISRKAGAALIRAALEKQVRILAPDAPAGARLDDHIARLSSRVSGPLGELLDVVRHVGNQSLHGDESDTLVYVYLNREEGSEDIADLLFGAVNDLVDELVARPAATSALWDKLPPNVKRTVERKRMEGQGTHSTPASSIDA